MSRRKRGSYLGGHTVLTQSRYSYEAEMARAARRAKRRAKLEQERYDEQKRSLQRKLNELAKVAPRRSPPVMPTMTPDELKQKYPEGVPTWMLGHPADKIDCLMQSWRKRKALGQIWRPKR
jgi:hypothetical protein